MADLYGYMNNNLGAGLGSGSDDDDDDEVVPDWTAPDWLQVSPDAGQQMSTEQLQQQQQQQQAVADQSDQRFQAYRQPVDYGDVYGASEYTPGGTPGGWPGGYAPQTTTPGLTMPSGRMPTQGELNYYAGNPEGFAAYTNYYLPIQDRMYDNYFRGVDQAGNLINDDFTRWLNTQQYQTQSALGQGELDLNRQLAEWGQQNALVGQDLAQQQQNLAQQTADRTYGLNYQDRQMTALRNAQQNQLAQAAQQLDQLVRTGQLSIQEAGQQLRELQNQQQYQMAQLQFGEGQRQFDTQEARLMAQLAQQAELQREQMAQSERNALISATGRNQRQRSAWQR